MKLLTLSLASLAIIGFAACNTEKKSESMNEDLEIKNGIDLGNLDTTIAPGKDFFQYANGGWIKKNPMPEEYSRWGAFEVLNKKNKEQIKTIIDEASADKKATKGSISQQIRDFYLAGMDTVTIEKLGITPLQPTFDEIAKLAKVEEMIPFLVSLNLKATYPLFNPYAGQDDKNSTRIIANLYQGGLGLPERDYYLSKETRSVEIRKAYINHLEKMFVLTGKTAEEAKSIATLIMKIETEMASASSSMTELRNPVANYNLMTMAEVQKEYPNLNIKSYFDAAGLAELTEVNVCQPKFFAQINKMIKSVSLEEWKTYLVWNVLNSNASLLSTPFEKQNFYFYETVLSGIQKQKVRSERMIEATNGGLGEAVGKIYVEKYFPKEAKEKMTVLVGNLKISLGETIKNLDWMSAETKEKALEKLAAINVKVGYPNKWKDYSSIDISADKYLQNMWNCAAFEYKFNLNKIGKPVDREEWGMTPQTVNAYYSPNMNEIVFPAAILQAPFFNINADDAVNYGAIGVVIGHEMTHGFDDQGCMYDKNGNLNNWWTKEDAEKFAAKTHILVEQFNEFILLDSLHVNGEMTLGENIADNGGLFVAYAALLKSYEKSGLPAPKDGLTYQQRFVISYAQVWRQSIRDEELMRRLKEDVHSPGEARVNGALKNLPAFYEAFNIKEGDPLYLPVDKRAKVW